MAGVPLRPIGSQANRPAGGRAGRIQLSMEGPESMEARLKFWLVLVLLLPTFGASARTRNFIVSAPTPPLAQEIAQAAETFRHDLAIEWLGHPLPDWQKPCPVVAKVDPRLGAGGRTSFMFQQRVPFGWDMEVQGSRERVLDSVLPHEITHTIFATHFGRPLPRWADEGACTTVEHHSERKKQELWLVRFLKTERGIPFNHMFAMTEYPGDILPLYSQGYSLARYLIAQGGKPKFVEFVGAGLDSGHWPSVVRQYYGYESLGQLQLSWVDWVIKGSREELADNAIQLASATTPTRPAEAARALATAPAPTTATDPATPDRGRRPLIDNQLAQLESTTARAGSRPASGTEEATQSWYTRREASPAATPASAAAPSAPPRGPPSITQAGVRRGVSRDVGRSNNPTLTPSPAVDPPAGQRRPLPVAGEVTPSRRSPGRGDKIMSLLPAARSLLPHVGEGGRRPDEGEATPPCPFSPTREKVAEGRMRGPRRRGLSGQISEEEPCEMKKDRGGEAQRIDPVEDSRMAFDQGSVVLHAAIPFDRRHRHATGEAHHRGDQ